MNRHDGGARRGGAMLVTMIALVVLMVLVLGAISFTGRNREAATSKARGDQLVACAETARRYVLAQLAQNNVQVTSLTLTQVLTDDPVVARQSVLTTGHYPDLTAQPTAVLVPSRNFGAAERQARELSNSAPDSTTLGGSYYRVVVKCTEPSSGRASEVEFVFRFGL